jgi:hypothetical protein
MKNNHVNLISNVDFEKLPDWFKEAKTKNAEIMYENDIFTWKDGTWKAGIWKAGIWETGIWEDGRWENGIWEDGIWEDGRWKAGTWKDGTWKAGFKKIGFCKWNVYYNSKSNLIKIGCKIKLIDAWETFFNSDEFFETKRNTKQFQNIYKSFLLAKFAIENKI